jgi:hypothetical protein
MQFYSFNTLKINNEGYYDLFAKTIVNKSDLSFNIYVVTDEFKGRLDLICKYLHGNTNYLEELMTINNITNPYSVKTDTNIKYFLNVENYQLLYQSDPEPTTKKDSILNMNKNKSTIKDGNRIGSPPTIKPDNLRQVDVNHSKRKITVINKFK